MDHNRQSRWPVALIAFVGIVCGCQSPGTGAGSAPPAAPVLGLTETFTSPLNGFTIKYPVIFKGRVATEALKGAAAPLIDSAAVDQLSSGSGAFVVMAAADIEMGATLDEWTAETALAFCGVPSSSESLTLDGELATLTSFSSCHGPFHQWVTSVRHGRGYHVIWANERGTEAADRALFLDMLATFQFGPATSLAETPQPTQRPTATSMPTTLGEPIPHELIGAWYHPSGAYWWLIRAGAPTCTTVAHTPLDCVAYQLVGQSAYVGAASMEGRVLTIRWTRGYCAGDRTSFGTGVVGDTLKLFDTPDDCGGDNLVLSRAGSGATPSAPPPPTS
jgi:hypothetical protein